MLITVFVSALLLFPAQKSRASSPSVEFIVDFSKGMDEKIFNTKKIDIARRVMDIMLENLEEPLDAGLTLYGHRDNMGCDDTESAVPVKALNREIIKKKLLENNPGGQSPVASALKEVAGRLKETGDYMNIVLVTGGEMTCDGDIIETLRELKQELDFRMIFHVIAIGPQNPWRHQLIAASSYAGYGSFHEIKQSVNIEATAKHMAKLINKNTVHTPRKVDSYDMSNMAFIPAGEFIRGSDNPESDPNELPARTIYLDAFYIDKYMVTQRQYKEVTGTNPSLFIGTDLPADTVNWFEAGEFCKKVGKRLPTEAEWEKAAKGGRNDSWSGTSIQEELEEYAWIHDTGAEGKTRPVGLKKPNGYGIYDMSGNLWEWVSDWFDLNYYRISADKNPQGPDKNTGLKALRGANWDSHIYEARTTSRYAKSPHTKNGFIGFRCAKSAAADGKPLQQTD